MFKESYCQKKANVNLFKLYNLRECQTELSSFVCLPLINPVRKPASLMPSYWTEAVHRKQHKWKEKAKEKIQIKNEEFLNYMLKSISGNQ